MANEEMQRTMQFILDQQTRIWDSIQSLEAIVQSNSRHIAQNTEHIAQHTGQIAQHTEHIGRLTDVVSRLTSVVEALTESQSHTDSRLNALIGVVERYFSDGPRGQH